MRLSYGIPWQYAGQVYAKRTLPITGQYEGLSTASNIRPEGGKVARRRRS